MFRAIPNNNILVFIKRVDEGRFQQVSSNANGEFFGN